jgi:hypothetical protein
LFIIIDGYVLKLNRLGGQFKPLKTVFICGFKPWFVFNSRVNSFISSLALRTGHNQAVVEDPEYPQKPNATPVSHRRGGARRKPAL